jgi:hypothetical protein
MDHGDRDQSAAGVRARRHRRGCAGSITSVV